MTLNTPHITQKDVLSLHDVIIMAKRSITLSSRIQEHSQTHLEKTMKKYLTLAAVLGAIAFASVSYLAHAQGEPATDKPAAAAPMTGAAAAPASAEPTLFEKDKDMCTVIASAPTTEGAVPGEDAKTAAYKQCMMGKGHTEEELAKDAEAAAAKEKADAAAKAATEKSAPAEGEKPAAPEAH